MGCYFFQERTPKNTSGHRYGRVARFALFVVFLLLGGATTLAGDLSVSQLAGASDGLPLRTHFHYLIDQDKNLEADRLLADDPDSAGSAWFRLAPDQHVKKLARITYWMRLTLHNDSNTAKRLLIVVDNYYVGTLQVFISNASAPGNASDILAQYQLGASVAYSAYPLGELVPIVPLDIPAGESRTFLMRARNAAGYTIEYAALWDRGVYFERFDWDGVLTGAYYGIGMIFIVYHLMIFGFSRERDYLLYVGLVSANLLLMLVLQGYIFRFMLPDIAALRTDFSATAAITMYLMSGWFGWSFLDLQHRMVRLSRVVVAALYVILACALISIVLPSGLKTITVLISMLIATVLFFGFWISSAWLWRHGDTNARHYNVAWSVYLLSSNLQLLYHMDVINYFTGIDALGLIGQSLLMLMLSFALASKMSEKDKQRALALMESRAKSEFLARMSHEIRNPMNGVLGMADLLMQTDLDQEQRRYSRLIKKSGTLLLNVINEILDYSKIEAGRLELEYLPMNLEEVVSDVVAMFRVQHKTRKIQLIADIQPGTPTQLVGDAMRLRQILVNLLSNAYKFTEQGEIRVHLTQRGRQIVGEEDRMLIHFSVSDSGVGISKEAQTDLFSAFKQADSSTTRRYGGTGLGLNICKQLVELMGGSIGVDSEVGCGSTFWFSVPMAKSQQPASPPLDESVLRGKQLLIVDDYLAYAEALQQHARSWGMQAQITANGESALDLLQARQTKAQHFDLIVVDLDMPGINGVELVRQIRHDRLAQETPCLLISSTSTLPDRAFLDAAGINRAISKPDTVGQLKAVFMNLLGEVDAVNPPVGVQAPPLPPNLQVLVAEDNDVNRMVIKGMLKNLGVKATVVENGEKAVAILKEGHDLYDLVLMDCEMPVMDGYEATETLRRLEMQYSLPRLPVVALSAHAVSEMVQKSLLAGMDEHLSKPIDKEALLNVIYRFSINEVCPSRQAPRSSS